MYTFVRRKRQEKELKNRLAREAKEKQELEKRQKAEKEREEKARLAQLMQEKQREEMERKRQALLQRAQEKEERRKLEEQQRWQKLQEQEEAERLLAEQRRREQDAEKRREAEARAQQQATTAETLRQKQQMLAAQAKVNAVSLFLFSGKEIFYFCDSIVFIIALQSQFYSTNKLTISCIKVRRITCWIASLTMMNRMTSLNRNMRYRIGHNVRISSDLVPSY